MPEGQKGFQPGHEGFKKGAGFGMQASPQPLQTAWRKQEAMRLYLEGRTTKEIALVLGCHPGTILHYAQEPEWREQLHQLSSAILAKLDTEVVGALRSKSEIMDEIATLALEEMKKLLTDPSTHVSIKAKMIDSALDRTPEVSRTKKLDVTTKSFSMSGEDLLAAAMAAREIEDRQKLKEAEDAAKTDDQQNMVRD